MKDFLTVLVILALGMAGLVAVGWTLCWLAASVHPALGVLGIVVLAVLGMCAEDGREAAADRARRQIREDD